MSSLALSVNVLQLDMYFCLSDTLEGDGPPEIAEMIPTICEFHTYESSRVTTKLLHAKRQDGQTWVVCVKAGFFGSPNLTLAQGEHPKVVRATISTR